VLWAVKEFVKEYEKIGAIFTTMFNGFEQKSIMENSGRSSIYLICSTTKYDPIHRLTIRCSRDVNFSPKTQIGLFGGEFF